MKREPLIINSVIDQNCLRIITGFLTNRDYQVIRDYKKFITGLYLRDIDFYKDFNNSEYNNVTIIFFRKRNSFSGPEALLSFSHAFIPQIHKIAYRFKNHFKKLQIVDCGSNFKIFKYLTLADKIPLVGYCRMSSDHNHYLMIGALKGNKYLNWHFIATDKTKAVVKCKVPKLYIKRNLVFWYVYDSYIDIVDSQGNRVNGPVKYYIRFFNP